MKHPDSPNISTNIRGYNSRFYEDDRCFIYTPYDMRSNTRRNAIFSGSRLGKMLWMYKTRKYPEPTVIK